MKTFELTDEEINIVAGSIEHAPTKGYSVADIRLALKVAEAVEGGRATEGKILLEDSQHLWLNNRIAEQQWLVASPVILSLVDKISSAATPA